MQPSSNVGHFFPFISTNSLVSANFENMRFLGPPSAGEGPHLVPISLKKIGSSLGTYFDKLGSPWHLAPVYYISADLIGWGSSWRSMLYFKIYVSWQYKANLVTDINIQQPLLSDTCSQTNRILSTEHHSRWTRFTSVITLHDIESGAGQWPSWCRLLWNIRARKVREKSVLLGYLMIDQWPMAINFNQRWPINEKVAILVILMKVIAAGPFKMHCNLNWKF